MIDRIKRIKENKICRRFLVSIFCYVPSSFDTRTIKGAGFFYD